MGNVMLGVVLVLATIYLVPIAVYGLGATLVGLQMPAGVTPKRFLAGVFVSKTGTALAFVLVFHFAREAFAGHWLLYALLWWTMFTIGEIGQAIGQDGGWKEAVAGIISETLYLPLSAWLVDWLLGMQ